MRRRFLTGSILALSSVLIFLLAALFISKQHISSTPSLASNLPASASLALSKDTVTITFAGDIMMDRGVKGSVNKNFNGDFSKLFTNIDIFKKDDISFANLEGPVSDKGRNVGSIYSFRMNPTILPILKNLGFDIFSVANNHAGDWTIAAFEDTLKRLNENEIKYTGGGFNYSQAIEPLIIEKNGIKIGFIGFSDVGPNWLAAKTNTPGILLASDKNFKEIIKNSKQKSDFLIVSFHFGDEYKDYNKRQEFLAHVAIDNGANIIIGHHPHVEQSIAFYKEKPIIYSLGNFMFDQYFSPQTLQGLITQIEVKKDGTINSLKLFQSKQNKLFQIESITPK